MPPTPTTRSICALAARRANTYTYDDADQITADTYAASGTAAYGYDSNGTTDSRGRLRGRLAGSERINCYRLTAYLKSSRLNLQRTHPLPT